MTKISKFPHLQQWVEGNESLVYCRQRCALMQLNSLETLLLEYYKVTQASDVWEESFMLDPSFSEDERRLGLQRVISMVDDSAPIQEVVRPQHHKRLWSPAGTHKISFRVESFEITICSSHKQILQAISELLQPLETKSSADAAIWHVEMDSDGAWQLGDRTDLWFSGLLYEEVVPILFDKIQQYSYINSNYQITFHSAALHWHGFDLLIPGVSGRGKSTLASAFALKGAIPFSDEVAVLDSDWRLHAVPLPFAIKSGSWDLIHKWQGYSLPREIWRRSDGRQLRYWWPPRPDSIEKRDDTGHSVAVILASYQPDASIMIREASLMETIQSMALGGYEQVDPCATEIIPSLIEWLKRVKRLEVVYGDALLAAESIQQYLEDDCVK